MILRHNVTIYVPNARNTKGSHSIDSQSSSQGIESTLKKGISLTKYITHRGESYHDKFKNRPPAGSFGWYLLIHQNKTATVENKEAKINHKIIFVLVMNQSASLIQSFPSEYLTARLVWNKL
jgi:hypothetical protein